jgi:hypothetical protein
MNIKKKIPAFFAGVASTSLLLYYDEIKNTVIPFILEALKNSNPKI